MFPKNAIWVSKNAEFDVDLESVEKVAKKPCEKSYQRISDRNTEFYFYYCIQKFSDYNFLG